jgi:acetyltransferase-like isoleucine patch superfamily enzyme
MTAIIHPGAVIMPGVVVEFGYGVEIQPLAVIGCLPIPTAATRRRPDYRPVVKIGAGTRIGPHACIYAGVEIGPDCMIAPGAVIREGVKIGARCVIGCGVEVNYETVIGDDCRIMSQTHLTGRMSIGAGSFFGVGVNTSNDRRIDLEHYEYHADVIAGPQVGRGVMVGTGANLLAGITIGDGAIIGSGALVTKDVPASAKAMSKGAVAQW